jgi:hypothetical protein
MNGVISGRACRSWGKIFPTHWTTLEPKRGQAAGKKSKNTRQRKHASRSGNMATNCYMPTFDIRG